MKEDAHTATARWATRQPFHPLSCRSCSESQPVHRSRVNSERGERWKAQQESRGGSAEVKRRPESRVRLSGTGSKMGRDGASPKYDSHLPRAPALCRPNPLHAQEGTFSSTAPGRGILLRPSPTPSAVVGGGGLLPWSKLSFLAGGVSPSPSISTRSLLASESFRALSVTSGRGAQPRF